MLEGRGVNEEEEIAKLKRDLLLRYNGRAKTPTELDAGLPREELQ